MPNKHVLVAGASGLVGYAALKHFAAQPDVKVTAVSRRKPLKTFGANFIAADLTDARQCAEIFGALNDVTHLVFAALHERPNLVSGWVDPVHIDTNDRMLRNLFDPLQRAAKGLRHVSLLQGTKAYGVHVRPFKLPAREDRSEARDLPNFYWRQEDYLKEQQARAQQQGKPWHWTIFRPQIIFGESTGSAMNLIPAIGVYGALLKEQGKPLTFPGGPPLILEAVDADLQARAIAWAGESDRARNQAFNVTNGDQFVWENLWPALADALGMQPGANVPQSLEATTAKEAAAWDKVRGKYGLVAPGINEYVGASFQYADFCFGYGVDPSTASWGGAAIVSTVKIKQAGFTEVMDTEAMFRRWFKLFQDEKLLPPR
ncbi:MAG: SDR family oxidoreductase [Nevskia sp.]|nr:SDR family oxidoreductase [Nevskia sp.]